MPLGLRSTLIVGSIGLCALLISRNPRLPSASYFLLSILPPMPFFSLTRSLNEGRSRHNGTFFLLDDTKKNIRVG